MERQQQRKNGKQNNSRAEEETRENRFLKGDTRKRFVELGGENGWDVLEVPRRRDREDNSQRMHGGGWEPVPSLHSALSSHCTIVWRAEAINLRLCVSAWSHKQNESENLIGARTSETRSFPLVCHIFHAEKNEALTRRWRRQERAEFLMSQNKEKRREFNENFTWPIVVVVRCHRHLHRAKSVLSVKMWFMRLYFYCTYHIQPIQITHQNDTTHNFSRFPTLNTREEKASMTLRLFIPSTSRVNSREREKDSNSQHKVFFLSCNAATTIGYIGAEGKEENVVKSTLLSSFDGLKALKLMILSRTIKYWL